MRVEQSDTLFTFECIRWGEYIRKSNEIKSISPLKKEVNAKKPLILHFSKEEQQIFLAKISVLETNIYVDKAGEFPKVESEESFKNGFYYGLNEIENIVDDVCDYYQDYFDYSEDYSVKKSIFKKGSKKIFSF